KDWRRRLRCSGAMNSLRSVRCAEYHPAGLLTWTQCAAGSTKALILLCAPGFIMAWVPGALPLASFTTGSRHLLPPHSHLRRRPGDPFQDLRRLDQLHSTVARFVASRIGHTPWLSVSVDEQ